MKPVIEELLDKIEWTKYEGAAPADENALPYATHEGIFWLDNTPLRVYQLSNGQRVFNAEDFDKLFSVRNTQR